MRIYLPATSADLTAADGISARTAHAVTAALRAASPGSEEELELPAFLDAADASLARLTADDVPVRVVVSADVAAAPAVEADGVLTAVEAPDVPWSAVVSIHVDDPDDEEAAGLVRAAVAGDEDAVEAVADLDMLWYDASERAELAARLADG